MHVAEAGFVEHVQLGSVRFRNVCKVLLVAGVDVLGVCFARGIAQVVPFRSGQGHFYFAPLLLPSDAFHVLVLWNVRRLASVRDLADADDRLAGLLVGLGEGGNVGHVEAEDVEGRVEDLLHPVQFGEKRPPEHVAA